MEDDPAVHDLSGAASDRRTALKKAAVAAGVVAWTTPAVQMLSSGTAHAQTTVTGCRPMITVTMLQTGKNCDCVPVPPECCNSFTYFPTATASCGDLCGGTVTPGVVQLTPLPPTKCPPSGPFPGTFIIGCPPTLITISATVTCGDGVTTKVDAAPGDIICKFCDLEVTQFDVPAPDEATTTTTELAATSREVAPAEPPPTAAAPIVTELATSEPATTKPATTEPATTTTTPPADGTTP